MKTKNAEPATYVEINGRRYDAQLSRGQRPAASKPRIISDFVVTAQPTTIVMTPDTPVITVSTSITPATAVSAKRFMDIQRPPQQHLKPHQQQGSQTLIRRTVHKPTTTSLKRHHKAVTRTDILVKTPVSRAVTPKISYYQVDAKRRDRATNTAKHDLVHHFSPAVAADLLDIEHKLAIAAVRVEQFIEPQRSMDVFERAIAKANTHVQQPVSYKKLAKARKNTSHQRIISIFAAAMIVLTLITTVIYSNRTSIGMQYASAKAGFQATLKSYDPAGFNITSLSYRPGSVSFGFDNAERQQAFTLTQQPSQKTVLQNLVDDSSLAYQALHSAGKTIYIFSNNDAAWLSNGKLYQITSHGNLSTTQILNVAQSI